MLAIGTTLGPYKILALIGAGGMGEVYRAHDTRLGRDVAIKVLPQHLSSTPEARARFEREARTISQLNHPHICTLHDVGHQDGIDYLVMELLEGETLAHRLEKGPLPVAEVLSLGAQIAEALDRAHRAGVVHRDLKPGNVMLTKGGAKLMDFGLARPAEARATDGAASQSRTMSQPLTAKGTIVGTFQYMAPEQLEGKEADARTDLFALGCVLYEMATGRRPFQGDSSASILGSILTGLPEALTQLDTVAPRSLREILRRCLDKDPAQRYSSAAELAVELKRLGGWARNEALPELARMVDGIQLFDDGPGPWTAFELAREIERLAPDDALLERLRPWFTCAVTIVSDPPGASVFAKYYGDPAADWIPLGRTPLESVRYPRGFTRLKLELPGYRTTHDVVCNIGPMGAGAYAHLSSRWDYRLLRPGEIPDEMEFVPGGGLTLYMPGLDYLKAEPTAAFLMDRHPVTNRQYKQFVEAGGYERKEHWRESFLADGRALSWEEAIARFTDSIGRPGPASWELGEYPPGEGDLPVTGVSWFEAAAYAAWCGKELPTIFHWNLVAFTVASAQIIPFANFSGRGAMPVGTTQSVNRFGVHDLAGNVREWAWNECDRPGERFILGGGWNDPEYAFADGYAQPAFDRSRTNGFRCIRALETEPNLANLTRVIDLPFRDFRAETPVSDETFGFFLRQFRYDKTPLDAVVESEEQDPLGLRQTISFAAAYGGERMLAHLIIPLRGRPPLQTVIVFPGSQAISMPAVGPAELRGIDYLLKSGRAVMLPIYKGTYQRSDELKSDSAEDTTLYKDHVIMWGKDLARSIDYLETRDDIDADRIAYYGLSWGGAMGAIMPAVEKRIKAVVLCVAGLGFERPLPEADQLNYITRVTQPTLMLNGELDFFFPAETSQLPMFDLLGTPKEHKKRISYPRGHMVPRAELIKETLAWLDRYLGPVR
jgi:dienelactone hydrolase